MTETLGDKARRLTPPFLHLVQAREGWVDWEVPNGFFAAGISGNDIYRLRHLFKQLAAAFQFPDYFGHNWAALDECLADLDWLEATGFVLNVADADLLLYKEPKELRTFLNVAISIGRNWANLLEDQFNDQFAAACRPRAFHFFFYLPDPENSRLLATLRCEPEWSVFYETVR